VVPEVVLAEEEVLAGDLEKQVAAVALVVVQEELEEADVLVEPVTIVAAPGELAAAAGAVDSLSLLLLASPLLPVLVQQLLIT